MNRERSSNRDNPNSLLTAPNAGNPIDLQQQSSRHNRSIPSHSLPHRLEKTLEKQRFHVCPHYFASASIAWQVPAMHHDNVVVNKSLMEVQMQIPGHDGSGRSVRHDQGPSEIAANGKPVQEPARAQRTQKQSQVGHKTDSQVANLRTQFQDQQLRSEVVAAARQEIASGSLLARGAAVRTAQSVVGIIKHF